jgi:hypothetical protein
MSIPDVGGRAGAGRPLQQTYHEQETTAQNQMAKQSLCLTQNTLDVMFTELGGNKWEFSANSSKPFLPMTVLAGLVNAEMEKENPQIQEEYEKLFKQLSLKLSQRLKENKKLPFEEQDPLCIIFEMVMRFAARGLVWLQFVEEITPELYPDSLSATSVAPLTAFNSIISVAQDTVRLLLKMKLKDNLEMNAMIKNNSEVLLTLIREGMEVQETKVNRNEKLENMLQNLLTLQNHIRKDQISYLLPNVKQIIDIAVYQTSGLLIEGKACAALNGMNTAAPLLVTQTDSWIGNAVHLLIKSLCSSTLLTDTQHLYLNSFAHVLVAGASALIIEGSGATRLSGVDIAKQVPDWLEAEIPFAITLSTTLFAESEVVKTIIEEFVTGLVLPPKLHTLYVNGLALMFWSLLLVAGSKEGKLIDSPQPLFEALQKTLSEHLIKVKETLETIESQEARRLGALVKQAEIAAREGSYKGYHEVILELIKPQGIRVDSVQDEMDRLLKEAMVCINEIYKAFSYRESGNIVNMAA